MACYPCTHCNKCGMYYSVPTAMVCAECGTVIPLGTAGCPNCGCRRVKAVAVSELENNTSADKAGDDKTESSKSKNNETENADV